MTAAHLFILNLTMFIAGSITFLLNMRFFHSKG